jgi:hypothetical protein
MAHKFKGYTVIHRGVDARGNVYHLVHYNGGSKYLWGKDGNGHVWDGFEVEGISSK